MKILGNKKFLLLVLIALAAFFRFYDLGRGNVISDESLYAFRSLGYLDFDFAVDQPSAPQLYNSDIPSWTKLSFHDHPALVFVVQHIFFGLGGENLIALRLSSVIFGLLSMWLVYLIGKHLFSAKAGVIAAALMSVNALMIYVSRTAIQESQVIFFILLSVYFLLLARKNHRYWLAFGAGLGLAILSKYTAAFILPVALLYFLLYDRKIFKSKYFYWSIFICLMVISPILIYNIMMYSEFGHFDFQISFMLGQHVPYWQSTPGKEIGTVANRFIDFWKNIWQYNFWLLNILFTSAGLFFLFKLIKTKFRLSQNIFFLALIIFFNFLLFMAIGPAPRFLTMIIPWFCLAAGVLLAGRRIMLILALFLVILEGVYAYNTNLAYTPQGKEVLAYSKIHWDQHDWGFNDIEAYLDKILEGKYPEITVPYRYEFLEQVRVAGLEKQKIGREPASVIVVYDENIFYLASLWYFDRQALYHSWPMITSTNFIELRQNIPEDEMERLSKADVYFVTPTEKSLLVSEARRTTTGQELENELIERGVVPETVWNKAGDSGFLVYKFSL